ncbi:MAG: hypothetical protein H0X51_08920, partial [Parachlamydiaceae bacterium]|nr:hypothetical protein [Parachlamydiaceae bacterium]
ERHHYLERDVEYFPRCGGHFDRPVRLVAAMSEEFLLPSNLPYEKGVEKHQAQHLQDIELTLVKY